MAIKLEEKAGGKFLEVLLTGKLVKEDYETLVPVVDRLVKVHGKVRLLVSMHDFHGWTAGALWEDTKFSAHHWRDIERLALVGETRWQEGMSKFCKPFTTAKIEYFDHTRLAEAQQWLEAA